MFNIIRNRLFVLLPKIWTYVSYCNTLVKYCATFAQMDTLQLGAAKHILIYPFSGDEPY